MQIEYIWIEKFRVIENKGYNFGNRYNYNYDGKDLKISINDFYSENFFSINEGEKIENVTALIGQNGAGKTTLLNFIIENLVSGSGGIISRCIIVTRNNDKLSILHHSDLNFNISSDNPLNITRIEYDRNNQHLRASGLNETAFIYYSNIFDDKLISNLSMENLENLYNISTNYLLDRVTREEVIPKSEVPSLRRSDVNNFRLVEITEQINFLSDDISLSFTHLNLPFELELIVKTFFLNLLPQKKQEYLENEFAIIKVAIKELSVIGDFKYEFYRGVFFAYVYEVVKFDNSPLDSNLNNFFNVKIEGNDIFEKILYFFKRVLKMQNELPSHFEIDKVNKLKKERIQKSTVNIEWLESIISLLEYFEENLYPIYSSNKKPGIQMDIGMAIDLKTARKFMQYYKKTVKTLWYLDFDWRNLSSGEKSLLNIYSRLYKLKDSEIWGVNRKIKDKDVVLLLDEVETYLHPQWQKEIIYNLLNFIPKLFPNNKIQFVITSHSPFIASDLPSQNIVYLGKHNSTIARTFAANIHTLLYDSFYLSDGAVGKFAKFKIDEILKILNNAQELNESKIEYIEKISEIIGEEILRKHIKLKLETISKKSKQQRLQYLARKKEEIEKELRELE